MTNDVIKCATDYAKDNNIQYIVTASITGNSLPELVNSFDGEIICVTHVNGYKIPGENEFPADLRQEFASKGVKFLTAAHVLSGAERGVSSVFKGMYPVEIIAQSLRMLGAGTKVGVECAVMALDAGLIPFNTKVLSLGGTGRGLDTAIVITPGYAQKIFSTRIHKILIKPEL
ncbi:MAG: pyruvate kinase alpha/beta domain-containing protein [Acidaminococcaceae bacterium]|nr:pyruvate kinase alpha/beta domain-containing protein [Acidaminococcaceae bacterium]MDD4721485.1 pyruvate kinase alpha/beta domain-containing protein [Acidaminococcaceae bacterium]